MEHHKDNQTTHKGILNHKKIEEYELFLKKNREFNLGEISKNDRSIIIYGDDSF